MSTTRHEFDWDNRGVRVEGIAVTFFVEAPVETWASFAKSLKMRWDAADNSGDFVAIPERMHAGDLYLTGSFHQSKKHNGTHAHWHLNWEAAPDDKPPKSLLERSTNVGGYPTVLKLMADRWPSSELMLNIDTLRVTYSIDTTMWRYRFVKHHPKAKKVNGHTLQQRATVWAVEPPCGPVSLLSIADAPKKDISVMGASGGDFRVRLSAELRQDVDAITWDSVMKFLARVES